MDLLDIQTQAKRTIVDVAKRSDEHLYYLWRELHRKLTPIVSSNPTSIWDLEWDILCILDGCRVDTFRKYHSDAESYVSVAASSKPWINRTFKNTHQNIAYISGNPFA